MNVKVEHEIRTGFGNEYYESYYYCPSCGQFLAYHNGVTLIEGTKSEKFCSNCGKKLDWPDPINEQEELDEFYELRSPNRKHERLTFKGMKELEEQRGLVREMFGNSFILVPKEKANESRVKQYEEYEKMQGWPSEVEE